MQFVEHLEIIRPMLRCYGNGLPMRPLILVITIAVLLAGCTPMQGSSVKVSGEYTVQAIAAEKK